MISKVKAIQSGKSGVAATSYITSYATKSDETPANQVSMIQTYYERMASLEQDTSRAETLLAKCVMQFGRERQLHAQQAVTYVRELGDILQSHSTTPMLSGRMLLTVAQRYGGWSQDSSEVEGMEEHRQAREPEQSASDDENDENDDNASGNPDQEYLPLYSNGNAHQVDDYLFRGSSLAHLSFYEFVRYCRLVKLSRKLNRNHHPLDQKHPNVKTFCHRYSPTQDLGIPRAIFSTFPRPDGSLKHGDAYCAAMLSHFRPFSNTVPLKEINQRYEDFFEVTKFSDKALSIMQNWNALAECEDARDHDRLMRRKQEALRESRDAKAAAAINNHNATDAIDDPAADVNVNALINSRSQHSAEILNVMSALAPAGWFGSNQASSEHSSAVVDGIDAVRNPSFDPRQRRVWAKEIDSIEAQVRTDAILPRATSGVLAESLNMNSSNLAPETTTTEDIRNDRAASETIPPQPTQILQWTDYAPH
ncbi:hypothetical protein CF319_g8839, partial [Tilletia indica]